MQLNVLLPSGIFASVEGVTRVVAMTSTGSFGILPHRLDCAALLIPGLLTYSISTAPQVHVAVDAGVMVKTGSEVLVCVRHAVGGADLGRLRQAVDDQMAQLSAQEKTDRTRLAHLESGLLRRFAELQRA